MCHGLLCGHIRLRWRYRRLRRRGHGTRRRRWSRRNWLDERRTRRRGADLCGRYGRCLHNRCEMSLRNGDAGDIRRSRNRALFQCRKALAQAIHLAVEPLKLGDASAQLRHPIPKPHNSKKEPNEQNVFHEGGHSIPAQRNRRNEVVPARSSVAEGSPIPCSPGAIKRRWRRLPARVCAVSKPLPAPGAPFAEIHSN